MSHEKVTRLRQLMHEAVPVQKQQTAAEAKAWRAAHLHEINSLPPALQRTWQAITIRKINRIAVWYALAAEIEQVLQSAGAESVESLSDVQLVNLHARLLQVEESYQSGAEAPPVLPTIRRLLTNPVPVVLKHAVNHPAQLVSKN